ncbi:tRNA (adenine22-N1)-methyltransferase [Pseudobutyrivibrio sp. 49]|uniref:tRNA (adenine(22)-N(1))-methyltransferase n=1 Tax=unclassified Pseudobutyrivibrio TaxID=2638619 RepID=UPI00088DD3F0|nr:MULTISPECIES: class I SAM-dependent methyltransferase [unclassified Pseudobutyrivibrio]SDI31246.1 tRNA (adenine22-N1)-methyltransferase [Pseudobutyrivibrio sp. 49]SFN83229.1 tRNA (adenine22-N1)-methyltransferase [Pseudobutyrivibrio sp. UC1225]
MIKLSPRLQIVYDMIPACDTVADVGCDHGYLSIALLENGVAKKVIPMDVNKGPLSKASENLQAAGFMAQADLRLSDGLAKLSPEEADVICICGMGGALIQRIIGAGITVAKSAKLMIIEPQSEYLELRTFLMEHGFVIDDEDLTCEENKIYPIIKLHYEADESKRIAYNTAQLEYGPKVIEKAPELLIKLLDKNESEYSSIINKLEQGGASEAAAARCRELRAELEIINQIKNSL